MANIGKIIIELAGNTASFQASMGKASRNMDRNMRNMRRASGRMKGALSGLGRGFRSLAAVAGVGLGVAAVKSFLDQADAIAKSSRKLGANVEKISAYRLATEKSGIEVNTFLKALGSMQRVTSDAAQGLGLGVLALKQLGINAGKFNDLSVNDKILALADALHGVSNAADRYNIASKIFGERGTAVLQLFGDGAKGVLSLLKEANAAGDFLTQKGAAGIERTNDRLTVAGSKLRGVAIAGAVGVISGIDRLRLAFGPSGIFAAMGDGLVSLRDKAEKALPVLRLLRQPTQKQATQLIPVSNLASQARVIADSNNRISGSFSAVKDAAEKTGSALSKVYDPAAKKAAALALSQKKQLKQMQSLASFTRRFILPDLAKTSQLRGSARVVSASRFAFNDVSTRESGTNKTLKRIEGILQSIDRKTARDQLAIALK